jgi:hypothetical protein
MNKLLYISITIIILIILSLFLFKNKNISIKNISIKKLEENFTLTKKNSDNISNKLKELIILVKDNKTLRTKLTQENKITFLTDIYNLLLQLTRVYDKKIMDSIGDFDNRKDINVYRLIDSNLIVSSMYNINRNLLDIDFDIYKNYLDDYSKTPYGYYEYYLDEVNKTITNKLDDKQLENVYNNIVTQLDEFTNEFDFIPAFHSIILYLYNKTIKTIDRLNYYHSRNFVFGIELPIFKDVKEYLDNPEDIKDKFDNLDKTFVSILQEADEKENEKLKNVISGKIELFVIKYQDKPGLKKIISLLIDISDIYKNI